LEILYISSWNVLYLFQQSVAQKSERIADEEVKCQHMADLAQSDLNEALPALEEALAVHIYIYFISTSCSMFLEWQ
jgi:hypothetical protein